MQGHPLACYSVFSIIECEFKIKPDEWLKKFLLSKNSIKQGQNVDVYTNLKVWQVDLLCLFLTQALEIFYVGLLWFSKGGGDLVGNAPVSLVNNGDCSLTY